MKIKALAANCKKEKKIAFWADGERQYVSDFRAVYPLDGLPWLNRESLLKIFDVPEKDWDKWLIADQAEEPMKINMDDTDDTESDAEAAYINVKYGGVELIPLYTAQGTVYINAVCLKPLADVAGQLTFHTRRTQEGHIYIAAKVGLLLQAVIFPMDVIDESFLEIITELRVRTQYAYDKKVLFPER